MTLQVDAGETGLQDFLTRGGISTITTFPRDFIDLFGCLLRFGVIWGLTMSFLIEFLGLDRRARLYNGLNGTFLFHVLYGNLVRVHPFMVFSLDNDLGVYVNVTGLAGYLGPRFYIFLFIINDIYGGDEGLLVTFLLNG